MDGRSKNKALFRAKLNAQKKGKRLDSPLIRYNDFDQAVCRVCDVILKSESQWDAHQASRKHHEAIIDLKAKAARQTQPSNEESGLPSGFFDNHGTEKQKKEALKLSDSNTNKKNTNSGKTHAVNSVHSEHERDGLPQSTTAQTKKIPQPEPREIARSETKQVKGSLPDDFFDNDEAKLPVNDMKPAKEDKQASIKATAAEGKQAKGALPEGFFDNKEADLRARGIQPVKIDVKDEYKEFEKLIQDDLRGVDDRMEEDEIDAADLIEEAESSEQKLNDQRMELLRKRKLELEASRLSKRGRETKADIKESSSEESSSDDDDDDFAVDWRAQHL